eukprot:CAMPEP_0170508192 /NCGR_PEP_ID=MMETSP0208-20121228/61549_1 /TAXON_ID=197538 /ORGANISM="Strombidium inclinatum, Strain S3" /LENGTH=91 /DNA_ID=CAMNT_0010790947 /DNA_START=156 /DNA_END=431 /DNA_ORIENTATION=+
MKEGIDASILQNYQSLKADFLLLISEIHKDKLGQIKEYEEEGVTKLSTRRKLDALAWHGRCLNILTVTQVQEALLLFKKSLVPSDKMIIRN